MSAEPRAGSMKQGVDDPNGLHAPSSVLPASVRWGIYLLLIAVAIGNITGRILAVNSVDKIQQEVGRFRDSIERQRKQLIKEGVQGEQLESRMAVEEARIRADQQLQRPFLSANDRSRWMTIRSLVERGTYEIDDIVG